MQSDGQRAGLTNHQGTRADTQDSGMFYRGPRAPEAHFHVHILDLNSGILQSEQSIAGYSH